jgi:hypothetical protein
MSVFLSTVNSATGRIFVKLHIMWLFSKFFQEITVFWKWDKNQTTYMKACLHLWHLTVIGLYARVIFLCKVRAEAVEIVTIWTQQSSSIWSKSIHLWDKYKKYDTSSCSRCRSWSTVNLQYSFLGRTAASIRLNTKELTRLWARENYIESCRRESFKTYIWL